MLHYKENCGKAFFQMFFCPNLNSKFKALQTENAFVSIFSQDVVPWKEGQLERNSFANLAGCDLPIAKFALFISKLVGLPTLNQDSEGGIVEPRLF